MSLETQSLSALPVAIHASSPAILGALIAAVTATVVLAYSWRRTREPWIGWLVVVWMLWVVRYLLGLLPDGSWSLSDPRQTAMLLARGAALAVALWHLGARGFAAAWGVAAIPIAVAAFVGHWGAWHDPYLALLLGSEWLMAAVVVARSPRLWSRVRAPTALACLVYAVLLGSSAWFDGAGLVGLSITLATAVHLVVASGVAVGVHQRMLDEREAAEQREARALEYVVRGVVPMCAYCRSVRDMHDAWVTLEQFVAEGTAGPVKEVQCPECASAAAPRG